MSCSRHWNVRKMVSASKWVSIFFLIRRFLNTYVTFFFFSNNSCDVSFDGRLTCQEKVKNSLSKIFHWFVNDEVFADWCKYVLKKQNKNKKQPETIIYRKHEFPYWHLDLCTYFCLETLTECRQTVYSIFFICRHNSVLK